MVRFVDARAKIASLLVFLIAVATTPFHEHLAFASFAALLVGASFIARVSLVRVLRRAALILPFSILFSLVTWWMDESARALALLEKTLLSAAAAVVLTETTPLTDLTSALESWRCPRSLILIVQFVHRYLFVITDQVHRMKLAAASRRGLGKHGPPIFQAAGGVLGVLFARSWERADGAYHAMLARGFNGMFPASRGRKFGPSEAAVIGLVVATCLAIRLVL